MLEFLQHIDEQLFYFINVSLANPFTDIFMPFITVEKHWFIFWGIMWLYLLIGGGKKGRIVAILVLFLVLISDQLSSNIFKHLFERVRPCNYLPRESIHLLVNCTGSFSFPSSHAVNNFAGAYFFSYFYPRLKIAFYISATLLAISRVFCGVHYPFDVIGGIVIGLLTGYLFIKLYKIINKKIKIIEEPR
jgi:undecaprenyl-diphosphatase